MKRSFYTITSTLLLLISATGCSGSNYSYCDCVAPNKEEIVGEDDFQEFMDYCQENYFDKLTDEENDLKIRECNE